MNVQIKVSVLLLSTYLNGFSQITKTDILLLGSDHFSQIYKKDNPNTDILTPKRQQETTEFISSIGQYKPDMIMVEILPEKQAEIDSLYTLYLTGKLDLHKLEDGRSEVYTIAFRLGKRLQLPKISCINAPGSTSQSLLDNGKHIDLYKNETIELRKTVGTYYTALSKGELSFNDYLTFLNQPETYTKIYHLRYITPARVTDGRFKNPDAMIDTAFINPKYIGAELTSVWKNRDYKIYSNIVTAQMEQKAKRVLVLIGVAHIGSLKSILRDDPAYNLVDASQYLP